MIDPATDYAQRVCAGEIVACRWVRLACARHLSDLEREDLVWEGPEMHVRLERFFRAIRHYKGEWAGQPLILEPSQWFVVLSVFGWKLPNGLRRFRVAYVSMARKNGKTAIAAAIGLWCLVADGEPSGEVYSVATKEDQAKISWNDAANYVRRSPGWADYVRVRVKEIDHDKSGGKWRPLGSDSGTLDGLNPSCVIADELHAWPDRALWDVLNSAFGARRQPLFLQITTAGDNPDGICAEQEKDVQRILADPQPGTADDATFGIVFTLDDGDRWDDPATWIKANPCLGVSKKLDYMERLCQKAKNSSGARRDFLIKQLNVWQTTGVERWLDLDCWDECDDCELSPSQIEESFAGCQIWGGADLARSNDLTAVCFVASNPTDPDGVRAFWRFYLPEKGLAAKQRRDGAPYDQWAREGWLTVTDGDVTDFGRVERDILAIAGKAELVQLSFDPHYAADLATRLSEQHELPIKGFRQWFSDYSLPCRELERLVIAGKFRHGNNPVARWCAVNTVARIASTGGMMPDKGKSKTGRIDGVTAALMALGGRLTVPAESQEIGLDFL
jgi:phage terminase large subunit-like protein